MDHLFSHFSVDFNHVSLFSASTAMMLGLVLIDCPWFFKSSNLTHRPEISKNAFDGKRKKRWQSNQSRGKYLRFTSIHKMAPTLSYVWIQDLFPAFYHVLKRTLKRLKVLDDVSVTFSRSKLLKTNKSRRKWNSLQVVFLKTEPSKFPLDYTF